MNRIALLAGLILLITSSSLIWFNSPYRYILEGKSKIKSGKAASAVEILTEASQKYQNNIELELVLAKAYLTLDKTDIVNSLVKKYDLINKAPNNNELLTFIANLAIANYKTSNTKLAEELARTYLTLIKDKKTSPQIAKELTALSNLMGEDSDLVLETAFDIAVKYNDSELIEVIRKLLLPKYLKTAQDLNTNKQYEESLKVLTNAEKLGQDSKIHLAKAEILLKQNDLNSAQIGFEEAIELSPKDESYKIVYAEALSDIAENTKDKKKKAEFLEKADLLLKNISSSKLKPKIQQKLQLLNATYQITESSLTTTILGDFSYPTLIFKIHPLTKVELQTYEVIFENKDMQQIDTIKSQITDNDLNKVIEITSMTPVNNDKLIYAKLFVDGKKVKEFKLP